MSIKENAQGGNGIITKHSKVKCRINYTDAGTTGAITYIDYNDRGEPVTCKCMPGEIIEISEQALKLLTSREIPVYKEFDGKNQASAQRIATRPRFFVTRA